MRSKHGSRSIHTGPNNENIKSHEWENQNIKGDENILENKRVKFCWSEALLLSIAVIGHWVGLEMQHRSYTFFTILQQSAVKLDITIVQMKVKQM